MSRWLLVDDDHAFGETLARVLTRRGLHVDVANTFADALQCHQQYQHDRVILDLNLDGDSGLVLLSDLLNSAPDARVVMLTAYASVATAVEAIKRGALNYLCKPVTADELLAAFEEDSDRVEPDESIDTTPLSVERLEWEHIQRVLMEHRGNISATARALHMHRRTLQRKLQKRPASR